MLSRAFPRLLRQSTRRPSPLLQCQRLRPPISIYGPLHPWPKVRQASTSAAAKALFKEYPFSFSLACVFILTGAGALLYSTYIYSYFVVPLSQKFPEPVANKLRRALFYSNVEVDAPKAVEYYKRALALAAEHGMDPFSDEVIGIKLTLVALMEKIGQHQKAIDILEIVRADCFRWVETIGADESRRKDRTRVLGKTVGISVKLGELYANEYIADNESAEQNLVTAVETSLKEQKRREEHDVRVEDEGPWMSNEEMGGALESLATHYEQKSLHHLSAPLYLHALALCPPTNCHALVLMNNLSISLAQQSSPSKPGLPPASRAQLIASARAWAEKVLALGSQIKPPARNEECDLGCAVATHNLGEFAEMEGLLREAKARYQEAGGLSKSAGFMEGMEKAEEGLRRIRNAEGG